MSSTSMRAIVVSKVGGPDVLVLEQRPIPAVKPGWVRIRIEAFGLNRAEVYTRQGMSPDVMFPRILGIECVGVVDEAPDSDLEPGQQVAALMGNMGRLFDGSYAEYTVVPRSSVVPFTSDLDWTTLGAIPEMVQTAGGSLDRGLELKAAETLLIRGGTSSVGLAAAAIAGEMGASVISTTRSEDRREFLLCHGSHEVIIDDGQIAKRLREIHPDGVDKVLELVGTTTLLDSLKCARPQGIVCMTGMLGNEWELSSFSPFSDLPLTVRLTNYGGDASDLPTDRLQQVIDDVAAGRLEFPADRVFKLEELPEAHRLMESSGAKGKLVVVPR